MAKTVGFAAISPKTEKLDEAKNLHIIDLFGKYIFEARLSGFLNVSQDQRKLQVSAIFLTHRRCILLSYNF